MGILVERLEQCELLGFRLASGTRDEVLDFFLSRLENKEAVHILTLNPEMIMQARADADVAALLGKADYCVADGVGVQWAASLLGAGPIQRYAGIELASDLLRGLARKSGSVYLIGAEPGVAQEAGRGLLERFPGLRLAGVDSGFFTAGQEEAIVARIAELRPDLILVGMGSPRQEDFICRHREVFGTAMLIGVGGALDVFSGRKSRAPEWFRRLGLEWVYRSLQDSSRLGRNVSLFRFAWMVLGLALQKRVVAA